MKVQRTALFSQDRITKNTVRFQEHVDEADVPMVGTIYVQKSLFGGHLPDSISVTVEWETGSGEARS